MVMIIKKKTGHVMYCPYKKLQANKKEQYIIHEFA